ncbi:hypothetical protein ACA910_017571 [Epithemia clementina (nom. ined.)]
MRLRRILSLHLNSSSLFALGAVIPALCYAIGYYKKSSSVNVMVVELFSWLFLTCHVLPEIIIDLNTFPKAKRKLPHMRYGKGPCMNFLQSMIFAASCIFQGIFFASTWSDTMFNSKADVEIEAYELLNLIAGHMWLVSGLLSVCSVGSLFPICGRSDDHAGFWERLANDLYAWTTITLCAAAYLIVLNREVGHILHIIVRGIWCVLGGFYLVNDFVEEYLFRGSEYSNEERRRRQKEPLVDEEDGP